jgi:hypothetical protein
MGFSEDEMKTSNPEQLLTVGESWFPRKRHTIHTYSTAGLFAGLSG